MPGGYARHMRDDIRQALAIDADSTVQQRTIDITTTGAGRATRGGSRPSFVASMA